MINIINSTDKIAERKSVILPFGFNHSPIQKIVLINFENDPDSKYIALEPQYFSSSDTGEGFSIIAYRNDGYIDVYDDLNLKVDNQASFDVAGKGLKEQLQVEMEKTVFEKDSGCLFLSFQFIDKYDREISLEIIEKTKMKSSGLNLLAPVGSSTENPSYLPIFFMYDFDFVRKNKTEIRLTIGGKSHKIDTFPYKIPKDFQWRYYTRYSLDCQIIEFASSGKKVLDEYELINDSLTINDNKLIFSLDGSLEKMEHQSEAHRFLVEFNPGFPDIRNLNVGKVYNGVVEIKPDPDMGTVSGKYSLEREGEIVEIKMNMGDGWAPIPDSLFTKLMFGKKSIFRSWPKYYYYKQKVNLASLESSSFWENKNTEKIK